MNVSVVWMYACPLPVNIFPGPDPRDTNSSRSDAVPASEPDIGRLLGNILRRRFFDSSQMRSKRGASKVGYQADGFQFNPRVAFANKRKAHCGAQNHAWTTYSRIRSVRPSFRHTGLPNLSLNYTYACPLESPASSALMSAQEAAIATGSKIVQWGWKHQYNLAEMVDSFLNEKEVTFV